MKTLIEFITKHKLLNDGIDVNNYITNGCVTINKLVETNPEKQLNKGDQVGLTKWDFYIVG